MTKFDGVDGRSRRYADGYGDSTRCIRAGLPEPTPGQPFLPGPVFASTYPVDPHSGPIAGVDSYGRPGNSTRRLLEDAIGDLETGQALAFASGMAAVSAALLALVKPGETVVVPADGYYQTRHWAYESLAPRGIGVTMAPTAGPYPAFDGVRLVLVESPANPGLDVCDIEALARTAHAAGALLVVDNTTATPLGQRPLELGADLVVASGTKALAGHSDLLIGYVATRDAGLLGALRAWRDATGGIPSPFDAWLAHRSLATLGVRVARQSENAAALARTLAAHPAVIRVRWPGLPADPAYPIASRQMRRMPGIVAFELSDESTVARMLTHSRLLVAATSFGGTHTTADRRAQWGDDTPSGFVRLSCGIEDPADLVADLTMALDAATPNVAS